MSKLPGKWVLLCAMCQAMAWRRWLTHPLFDPEPLPPHLLAGQHGERGEKDHRTRTIERCRFWMRQDSRRHAWDCWTWPHWVSCGFESESLWVQRDLLRPLLARWDREESGPRAGLHVAGPALQA